MFTGGETTPSLAVVQSAGRAYRLSSNELTMTQELIANMLGVRREGVTEGRRTPPSAFYLVLVPSPLAEAWLPGQRDRQSAHGLLVGIQCIPSQTRNTAPHRRTAASDSSRRIAGRRRDRW